MTQEEKETLKAANHLRYLARIDKVRQYYQDNKERINAKQRERYQRNKADPEFRLKRAEYNKQYYKTHPEFRSHVAAY